ncbi:MAG: IS1634 family transposase [Rivularia sp. (in: cyanobacteria)]
MSTIEEIEIHNIDHLGIVAGVIDSIGLVEIVNNFLGEDISEKISSGHVVKAMILNGLGFVSAPLYMFSKFFENKACEHLIGEGVKPEYLNDDKLGRTMDKLFSKGLSNIFLAISLNAVKKFDVSLNSEHLDSSSFHLHGEYNGNQVSDNINKSEIDSYEPEEIKITYGYSRDHRPDLKQFIIDLICSGDGDIPIFFKTASGNEADSASFAKILVDFKKQIEVDSLMVADSALYTAANLKLLSDTKWLSRVPLSLAEAKRLVSSINDSELVESQIDGYSYVMRESSYSDVKQRWLIVQSEARKQSDLRQLEKRIHKSQISATSQLKKLQREEFNCSQDAMKAASKLSNKIKYHNLNNIHVDEKMLSGKTENQVCFKVIATLSKDEVAINNSVQSAGRFVLATNILDENILSNSEMISEYKAQQSCERGFGFLKDPLFFADSVFLKTPKRIESLAMIMALSLLVYTLAQRQIRAALSSSKSTIKNQLGKPTERPTLRWIFQCFQSIHLVFLNNDKQISNLTENRKYILNFLPSECYQYYQY